MSDKGTIDCRRMKQNLVCKGMERTKVQQTWLVLCCVAIVTLPQTVPALQQSG